MRKSVRSAVSAIAVVLAVCGALTACGSGESASVNGVTTLRYLGWNQQVTYPELAESLGYFNGKIKLDWQGNTTSGPQEIQSAATKQVDFGGAFAGAVAKLASAGAPITAVINYYGADAKSFNGIYTLENSPVRKPADLVGKKVAVNTLGGQNEADIYTVLKKNGVSDEAIESVQLVPLPPPNLEDALRKGQVDAAALSGQFQQRALSVGGIRPVFTETEEFGPINGGPYVFRNDFIEKNPDAVRAFTTGVAKAIEWSRTTPRDQVIKRFSDIINVRQRPGETTETLKYWLSPGVPSIHGELSDGDFTRWEPWLRGTDALDGDLDPSSFYTNDYNDLITK